MHLHFFRIFPTPQLSLRPYLPPLSPNFCLLFCDDRGKMAAAISLYRRLSSKLLKSSYASSFSLSSTPNPQILIPKPLSFLSPTFSPKPTNFNPTFDRSSSSFYGSIREKPKFFSTDSGSSSSEKPNPNPSQNSNFKLTAEQKLSPLMSQTELLFMKLYRSSIAVALLGLVNLNLSRDPDSSLIMDPNFLPVGFGIFVALAVRCSVPIAKNVALLVTQLLESGEQMTIRKETKRIIKVFFFGYSLSKAITIVVLVYTIALFWCSYYFPEIVSLITNVVVRQILVLWTTFIITLFQKQWLKFFREVMLRI